ncbi:MAG: dienelactone hydrolase family protein [Sulfolobales archaeon]
MDYKLLTRKTNIAVDDSGIEVYIARPAVKDPLPAVILIHEIWGLEKHMIDVANRIASEGYMVVAPDLYSRPDLKPFLTTENVEKAMSIIRSIPQEKRRDPSYIRGLLENAEEPVRKVLEILFIGRRDLEDRMVRDLILITRNIRDSSDVIREKIAVMGFCMGGGLAFQLSTEEEFKATIVFYGSPPNPIERVSKIKGSVMGIYAGYDPPINSLLPQLIDAIVKYGVDFEMKIYPGTYHGFFNNTRQAYNEEASLDAWERVKLFLEKKLKRVG